MLVKSLPKEYYQQLEEIQAVDFVVYELVLYLDTHPNDSQAIQQYNQYIHYSKQLKAKFEALYGPLHFSVAKNLQQWEWSDQPWPWQV